jgi:branched-chain amino acid aminotransferase
MKLWLNGAILDAAAARIDPADRGFTLGDGLFETIRVAGGKPVFWSAHCARLRAGAAVLGITVPYHDAALARAILDLLAANSLTEAAFRLTVTRGPAARGVLPAGAENPTILITASPMPPPPPPARAIICTVTRRNEASPLSRIKSLNYLDSILARQEAARRGADEAILLNTAGRVAEASAANIFLIRGGGIFTPPVAEGALPGIMRAMLIARHGVIEQPLTVEELHAAEAIFLSNALSLRALASLDGTRFDLDHPVLKAILHAK